MTAFVLLTFITACGAGGVNSTTGNSTPTAATSNGTTGAVSIQPGTETAHILVTLTAATRDGTNPPSGALEQSAQALTRRLQGIPGATVAIVLPDTIELTAPGANLGAFDGLLGRGILNLRPVTTLSGTPVIGDEFGAPSALTSGYDGTITTSLPAIGDTATDDSVPAIGESVTATTPEITVATTSATPPAAAPSLATWPLPGSNPGNASQPAGMKEADWSAWVDAATRAIIDAGITCDELERTLGKDDPDLPLLSCSTESPRAVYLLDPMIIPGTQISDVSTSLSANGAGRVINISFTSAGLTTWSSYTSSHLGTLTAFTVDGRVLLAPRINGEITTRVTEVSGTLTQSSAEAIVAVLDNPIPLVFAVSSVVVK